jgi:hypothetical protein
MSYEITTTKVLDEEGSEINTYGIKYGDIFYMQDISTKREDIIKLICNLNKYCTNVANASYVIEDFIEYESNYTTA